MDGVSREDWMVVATAVGAVGAFIPLVVAIARSIKRSITTHGQAGSFHAWADLYERANMHDKAAEYNHRARIILLRPVVIKDRKLRLVWVEGSDRRVRFVEERDLRPRNVLGHSVGAINPNVRLNLWLSRQGMYGLLFMVLTYVSLLAFFRYHWLFILAVLVFLVCGFWFFIKGDLEVDRIVDERANRIFRQDAEATPPRLGPFT